jgi:raffinose/stachyose/melibiose transport system permease protein
MRRAGGITGITGGAGSAEATSPQSAAADNRERSARRRRNWRKPVELAVLLTPALVLFVGFVLIPVGVAVYYSIYRWSGFGPLNHVVGLRNYRTALADPVFHRAILHNLIIAGLSLVIQLPVSIALALLLHRKLRGRSVLRLVVFAPYVLSEAVTAVVWLLMLQPGGFVDQVFKAVGADGLVHPWLASRRLVLYTLFVVITWKYVGFGIVLLLAGLQGIPAELNEAAALDGAEAWQRIRQITLPLLGPTIRIWIFLSMIGSLQLFDLVWIMTIGGPASSSTTMAVYMVDHGFRRYQFGYGSAVAVILFIICFVFALLYQRFALRRDVEGAMTRAVG